MQLPEWIRRLRGPTIEVAPSMPEWDERPEDYREAVELLRRLGYRAKLADQPVPHAAGDPEFVPLAFLIFISVKVADAVVAQIVKEVVEPLIAKSKLNWRKTGGKVKGMIYGPDGNVLHEFEYSPPDSERD